MVSRLWVRTRPSQEEEVRWNGPLGPRGADSLLEEAATHSKENAAAERMAPIGVLIEARKLIGIRLRSSLGLKPREIIYRPNVFVIQW